jgi:subtilisin family serine protease
MGAGQLAGLTLLVGLTGPTQAHADVVGASVLVQLEPGSDVPAVAMEQMAAVGGHLTALLDDTIGGYAAVVPVDEVAALRGRPGVVAVATDEPVVATAVQQTSAPWHLDRIDQRALPLSTTFSYDTTGVGVDVYVVDSGIDTANPDFAGRASSFGNFSGEPSDDDRAGHGTAIAGIIGSTSWGVAKGVSLHSVKVLDSTGAGTLRGVVEGLEAVVDWRFSNPGGPAVVNLSLGTPASDLLDFAVQRVVDAGVTVVVAAGNDGADACQASPARVASAITVGATDQQDARGSFSNYGSCLDLFAPGVDISSTASQYLGIGPVLTASGTSEAAPQVTGAAARYLQTHPTASPAAVAAALEADATQGVVTDSRSGDAGLLYIGPTAVLSTFRAPVDVSPVRNTAQAGRTIPFAFTARDATGSPLLGLGAADVTPVTALSATCGTAPLDTIESYTGADPGQLIDLGGGAYQYNLKTAKAWSGTCGQVGLKVLGTVRTADFAFKA